MGFKLTDFDNGLLGKLSMKALGPAPIGEGYNHDGGNIPFQFPPKITSDSKTGVWIVKDIARYEPLAIFMGAGARHISLEITYVATGHKTGVKGPTWNTLTISNIVKDLRGILYSNIAKTDGAIWELSLYEQIPGAGGEKSTWRTINVSEKPGDTLIGIGGIVYPFRTDITLELELITKVASKDGKETQKIGNAVKLPKQKWY